MRIILSPAKKMNADLDSLAPTGLPDCLGQTRELLAWLQGRSHAELQKLWSCNDRIAQQNFERLAQMELERSLTPAILAYDGIAFRYMAPAVFDDRQFAYVQEHLRILSAFYGVLRPMDGVTPYRLEMQAKASIGTAKDLYAFWGNRLYDLVRDDSGMTINLASKEYSRCIERYLVDTDRYITITFCERAGEKLVTRGTHAKMARGEMVRFMAEYEIEDPDALRSFDRLGYRFRDDLSSGSEYVFERNADL